MIGLQKAVRRGTIFSALRVLGLGLAWLGVVGCHRSSTDTALSQVTTSNQDTTSINSPSPPSVQEVAITGTPPGGVGKQLHASPLQLNFKDVTQAAGLNFRQRNGMTGKHYFLEFTGSGACWFDYDNDGWMDLYIVQNGSLPGSPGYGPGGNRLYHNNGNGTFTDVTAKAGVAGYGYGQGCCAADIDNDGFVDLFVTCYGHNILYHNNGNGTFTDITAKAGLAQSTGWSTSAAFADYDNDGFVDLYVGHYSAYKVGEDPACTLATGVRGYCPPNQYAGASGRLYHNNGNGTFTDVTQAAGVENNDGKNLGVVWGDFNNDGKIDLFIANDNRRNLLYQNNGNGTFSEVGLRAGVALKEDGQTMGGMGTDLADYDNDGLLDIFVANFADEPDGLWHNRGQGLFDDVTAASDIGPPSLERLGFGMAFFDADLDGFKDIVVANGHVQDTISHVRRDASFPQPALFFHNLGNGKFADASKMVGRDLMTPHVGRGLCVADYDNDGDLDVLITSLNAPVTLLRNDGGNKHHWLSIRCTGTKSNRDGIGARVTVWVGATRQVAEVRSASSYLSQNDPRLYFGLGPATSADRIEVRWPSGRQSTLSHISANQMLHIVEGAA